MIARIVRSEDFERVLRTRTRAHSQHFAVHHVAERPSVPSKRATAAMQTKLSTSDGPIVDASVDDSSSPSASTRPDGWWFGAVVPKRHARRAVTRTLLKRQIRAVVTGHAGSLPRGLWVIRLRAPFDRGSFISAASEALKRAARTELEQLMRSAVKPALAR